MSTVNTPQIITTPTVAQTVLTTAVEQPKPVTTVDDIVIPEPEKKEGKSNLLAASLTGLALIGIGGYLLHNLKKGKGIPEKTIEMFKKEGNVFERGIAKTKDGTLFSGKLTQKTANGDKIERYYVNGRLQRATKNVDDKGFYDPTKAVNYDKTYQYTPEGKLTNITRTTGVNGEAITTEITRPVIQKSDDFAAQGGKVVDGKAFKADDTPYTGIIVEQNGTDRLLKEYKDGKLVSERLNTTLKDRVTKPDGEHYVRNEAELDEIAKQAEEAAKKAQEAAEKAAREAEQRAQEEAARKAAEEADKNKGGLFSKIKNFFKKSPKKPQEPEELSSRITI